MESKLSETQLDALREVANIGSGNAATALSTFVGGEVAVSVPRATVLPLAAAVEAIGEPASLVTGVALPVCGDVEATLLLLMPPGCGHALCALLQVDPDSEVGRSALAEMGNILASSYLGALAALTGMDLRPRPPATATDMLAAIVSSLLAVHADEEDTALLLDSELALDGKGCAFALVLVPAPGAVEALLDALGLAG